MAEPTTETAVQIARQLIRRCRRYCRDAACPRHDANTGCLGEIVQFPDARDEFCIAGREIDSACAPAGHGGARRPVSIPAKALERTGCARSRFSASDPGMPCVRSRLRGPAPAASPRRNFRQCSAALSRERPAATMISAFVSSTRRRDSLPPNTYHASRRGRREPGQPVDAPSLQPGSHCGRRRNRAQHFISRGSIEGGGRRLPPGSFSCWFSSNDLGRRHKPRRKISGCRLPGGSCCVDAADGSVKRDGRAKPRGASGAGAPHVMPLRAIGPAWNSLAERGKRQECSA